jgi:hypothetical protein
LTFGPTLWKQDLKEKDLNPFVFEKKGRKEEEEEEEGRRRRGHMKKRILKKKTKDPFV